ncbi:MAG: FtsQ-type POTRA domain-containing protein [Terracidiphilus sp.]|nr:FtsQ-type POTRA domain-containing protein [Terracidiphilus sp.]
MRRAQQVGPRVGRAEAHAPLDADDADEEVSPEWVRRAPRRGEAPRTAWWKPASSFGRALLALGVLTVVGGAMAGALLLRSELERDNRFRIAGTANIQATGLSEVSRADLLPVFGEDIGKNIFFIHLDQRRRDLEAIPWVRQATVMRVLPDQIRVTVVERKPVAFAQIGGETGLVDAEGVLLTMPASVMAERHYSFPAVTGLNPSDPADARKARMSVYMRMMAELDGNGQRNSEQISEVDLSNADDARVKMADQGGDIVAHLGEDRFLERYQRYMKHIGEWRQQYPRLIGVDLRYDRQAVLQMAPAGAPMPGENGSQPGAPQMQNASAPTATMPAAAATQGKPATKSGTNQTAGMAGQTAGTAGKNRTASGNPERVKAERLKPGKAAQAAKTKAERARAERARIEKARLQQRRHEAARHATLKTAQHRALPAMQPAAPVAEGQ